MYESHTRTQGMFAMWAASGVIHDKIGSLSDREPICGPSSVTTPLGCQTSSKNIPDIVRSS